MIISKTLRKEIKAKKYDVCYICGGYFFLEQTNIDHIIPIKSGGKNHINNCVYVHVSCNSKKAERMPNESEIKRLSKEDRAYVEKQLESLKYTFHEDSINFKNEFRILSYTMP